MATLRDIAEETGLAVGTVSRVLRNRERVTDETRQRVFEAAERLKYRPNLLVQGIQKGRTQSVGVILRCTDMFRARLLSGITDELVEAKHVPVVISSDAEAENPSSELELIHALVDRRVDGVILFPEEDDAPDEYLREVWERGMPLVTVDREMPRTHADHVGTDDYAGARMATEHLLGLGHRRLGHIAGPARMTTGRERRRAFDDAVQAVEGAESVVEVTTDFYTGYEQAVRMLAKDADRPSAIFCATDLIAAALYRAAAERGISIPQELSVVGFADMMTARFLHPQLSTVRQFPELIGRRAARMLLDRLEGRLTEGMPEKVSLLPEFVSRDSTAPLPGHAEIPHLSIHV